MRRIRVSVFAFAAVTLRSACSRSLGAQAQSVAELAAYSGADRTNAWSMARRKENALMILLVHDGRRYGALINAFQAKYAVQGRSTGAAARRHSQPRHARYSASRHDADLAETAGTGHGSDGARQVLPEVTTPVSKELIPQATFCARQWISTRLSVFAAAYNTNIIKRRRRAQTYQACLKSRFRASSQSRRRTQLVHVGRTLHGRREGPQALPRYRRPQWHVGPKGPHPAREPGTNRRGAARRSPHTAIGGAAQDERARSRSSTCRHPLPFRLESHVQARPTSSCALLFRISS